MLLPILLASGLAAASPGLGHHPRQANSSTAASSAAITGTAGHNCSWTWSDWLSSSVDASYSNPVNITSTYTYHNITASLTTECDNATRIVGDLTTIATGTNTTFTSTYANYTAPSPTCTPEHADCASLNAFFGTYPCPRPTTNTQACGQCSIWGGTVDLIYFPITATTPHTLCPNPTVSPGSPTICPLGPTTATANATNPYDYQPCYYATSNETSTANSGPYVVSDGHTFYQNRAYISLQTAYASDMCGIVGEKHEGTILEVKSQDVYSVGGYHHEFQDAGYQFNFADLQEVPEYAYYLDCDSGGPASCDYQGTRYRYGTDFLNGYTDIDLGAAGRAASDKMWIFQEAYTPILLLPTQIRGLDPAWASCSLNLGGLYDPPKALTQVATLPGPTAPTPDPTNIGTTAQPGNGPTTSGPTPTALPITEPTTTAGGQPTDTPDDPTRSDGGDTPSPTTPNDPEPTAQDPEPTTTNDSEPTGQDPEPTTTNNSEPTNGADPTTANSPEPTNSVNGGGNDDEGDNNGNGQSGDGSGNDADDSPATTTRDIGGIIVSAVVPTTTTQNIGGIVASVIGMTSADEQDAPAATSDSNSNSESDQNDQDSPGPSDDDNDAVAPGPVPVTVTADDGSTQTISAVQGTSNVFAVGEQTVTAGGSAVEVDGQTISAGSSGQVVVGTQTITAASASAPSNGAPTGSDGSVISISTVTAGSSGVYVAEGTSLSVGGDEQVVNGATLSAAPTGVVDVKGSSATGSPSEGADATEPGPSSGGSNPTESGSSSDGTSTTGSASSPEQTGNTAASLSTAHWISSAAAGALAVAFALR